MTQHDPQNAAPAVNAEWQAADMPGQYQSLLNLLFDGTGSRKQHEQLWELVARTDDIEVRLDRLESDDRDVAA